MVAAQPGGNALYLNGHSARAKAGRWSLFLGGVPQIAKVDTFEGRNEGPNCCQLS